MADPVTGPISREELAGLANAPFGEAHKTIRKHDPLWGKKEGEKIEWNVEFEREVTEYACATVKAESEEEARKIAENLKEDDILWDDDHDPFGSRFIASIEPIG